MKLVFHRAQAQPRRDERHEEFGGYNYGTGAPPSAATWTSRNAACATGPAASGPWTFDNGFDDNSKRVMEVHDSSRTADEKRLLHAKNAQLHVLLDRYIEFDQ
ncbi:MAG: hypothetical protein IPL81_14405 [Flavobacteriales bacterium]|nr:hypothetical protein [Flavobacteriales bacterium]